MMGTPIGWISAFINQNTWEIHPIAVAPEHQQTGVGASLVSDMEQLAKDADAVSVWAGTGDETNSTSFSEYKSIYRQPSDENA